MAKRKCRHQWVPYQGRISKILYQQTADGGPWEPFDNLEITAVKCVKCGAVKSWEGVEQKRR
ncbi:MAG: hypothetical protein JRD89_04395 [Deltaproteobacteria bacterium]|nr:hypothetical protein [Deltaproteobacteria bacterium]